MRIALLCDGSVTKGLGHLFRTASFASIAGQNHDVIVIANAMPQFALVFKDAPCKVKFISGETGFSDALEGVEADLILFDMITVSTEEFEKIQQASPYLGSISPVFNQAHLLDFFFTRGFAPKGLEGPEIFEGLDYTIINTHCRPIEDVIYTRTLEMPALPVMISFGGADADNHSRMILELLKDVKRPLVIWLMLGDGYTHSHDELVETIKSGSNHEIIMARTNRSMWSVAANCSLAILSSGLSTVEAIYAGLPVISVQRGNDPSQLIETEYDKFCVDGGSFVDGSYRKIQSEVERFYDDRALLFGIRDLQKGFIDGKGADRILKILEDRVVPAAFQNET